jgi:hypothetical protein
MSSEPVVLSIAMVQQSPQLYDLYRRYARANKVGQAAEAAELWAQMVEFVGHPLVIET